MRPGRVSLRLRFKKRKPPTRTFPGTATSSQPATYSQPATAVPVPETIARDTGANNAPAEIIPAAGPQAFVTAEGEYMRYVSGGYGYNLGGGEIALGTSFAFNDTGHFDAQVSVGVVHGDISQGVYGLTATATAIPILASVRYNFHLNPSGTNVFYIGPTIGAVIVNVDESYYGWSSSESAKAFMGGGDAGFRFNLEGGLDFVAGVGIYKIGSMTFNTSGTTIPSGISYVVKAGLSYRF